MKALLTAAVLRKPADYIEVRVEESIVTDIAFRGKEVDNLGQSVRFGGNVRARVDGGWGFVSFNSLDDLDKKVGEAIGQARLVSSHAREKSVLAPVPVVVDTVPLDVTTDARQVPLAKKKQVLDGYNSIILGYGRNVTSSSIAYFDHHRKLWFANSEGTCVEQEKLDVAGSISDFSIR
ncbi:MAG: DNA gyrase modulator [Bacillota bacterium]|nr:DNA gyrase modulator [Bacillota bacterium]